MKWSMVKSRTEESSASKWASLRVLLLFFLLMVAGFVLAFAGPAQIGFQDVLFGSGILLWVVAVFGAVYCIVRRITGPEAAKLAVVVLFLILLSGSFRKRNPL